jgi:hypothetical protein
MVTDPWTGFRPIARIERMPHHVFLAGIMQGSHRETMLHDQDYRSRLHEMFTRHWPGVTVYDPFADHVGSLEYDDDTGRQVFFSHNRMCRVVDLVVAFIPEASMGTAIEMWEAHEHGRGAVVTVSPLVHNWVVRFCSDAVYRDLAALEEAIVSGELHDIVESALARKRNRSSANES